MSSTDFQPGIMCSVPKLVTQESGDETSSTSARQTLMSEMLAMFHWIWSHQADQSGCWKGIRLCNIHVCCNIGNLEKVFCVSYLPERFGQYNLFCLKTNEVQLWQDTAVKQRLPFLLTALPKKHPFVPSLKIHNMQHKTYISSRHWYVGIIWLCCGLSQIRY